MSILTRSKVTEIFCIADDFYKELEKKCSRLPFVVGFITPETEPEMHDE